MAVLAIISLGVLFRLFHFFYNRSLWEDEVYLSTGIVEMSLRELLTKPLPHLQSAPPGYLLIAHSFVVLFGKNEQALRLYSLVTGVAALFLFVPVARYFLRPLGTTVALALLAFAPPLVYHAVEAKPYGPELFVTILIMWLYVRYKGQNNLRAMLRWGIWSSVLVWFAYSSVFVLAGLAVAVGAAYLHSKQWPVLLRLLVPAGMGAVSFGVVYWLFGRQSAGSGWLVYFFYKCNSYLPLTSAREAVVWLGQRVFLFFHYPLGLSWSNNSMLKASEQVLQRMSLVPVVLIGAGVLYFYKHSKQYLLLLAAVLLLAVAASALKAYPFIDRLTVYLAPLVILLLAGGCDYLVAKRSLLTQAGYALALLLVFGPLKNSVAQVVTPYLFGEFKKSYHREAIQYINANYRPGDAVYIHWNEKPAYNLYRTITPLRFTAVQGNDYRHAVGNFPEYFARMDAELHALPNTKRVWVIWSNTDTPVGNYVGDPAWYYQHNDGVQRFRQHLMSIGKRLEGFNPADGNSNTMSDAHVSLMELY
ncbi:glycosyltransferase family 39 protein [Hymenobacter sp. BT186]|uniref:Glycosyltransferase family 39 protein n=1 Tax=Hymenobacter telluris TaxID=2816474 RepID=A0A939F1A9_9BACT|nr:glycosyltransferase family 39 protein [Hymenobacter telluris]MBO0360916.1 glycosyltransferase family 39 protein [Hymenobacter telluris]MBW3376945.1 glycosyltransferase family 39 protein [Hymenobacter norwichensis]